MRISLLTRPIIEGLLTALIAGCFAGISPVESSPTIPQGGTPGTSGTINSKVGNFSANDTLSAAHWFSSSIFFNQSVKNSPARADSPTLINTLASNGGWGNGNIFQVDTSIDLYFSDDKTSYLNFSDDGVLIPDSDVPLTVPTSPTNAAGYESSSGRDCDGGDCHYLAVDTKNKKLYEAYQASQSGSAFHSGAIVVVWDFLKTYPTNLRGDVCTSADAGGLPIAPLLFTSEEVAAGLINHAIRFILPNNRIQYKTYVRPATHGTGASSGWATVNGIPYGARFRLKSSVSLSALSKGAKVVATALQEYGMILADGGNIALTAKSDAFSTTKWSTLLGPRDLQSLKVTDFEIIDSGPNIPFSSFDCTRTP